MQYSLHLSFYLHTLSGDLMVSEKCRSQPWDLCTLNTALKQEAFVADISQQHHVMTHQYLEILHLQWANSFFDSAPMRLHNYAWVKKKKKNNYSKCKIDQEILTLKSESEVSQSRPTLWDPMDCSLPGSSVHGISQARLLEDYYPISFSRGIFPT